MKNVPVGGLPAAAVCSENHFFRAYGYVFGSFSTENVPVGRLPGAAVGSSIFSSGYGFDPGYGEVELLSGEKEGPWAEVLGWKKGPLKSDQGSRFRPCFHTNFSDHGPPCSEMR